MTAILAIESGKLDETVTVSKNAQAAPEVKMHLKEGEEYILKDLLYPLMLESSNDAAVAIAEHIGGSVEGFAELMNKKAKELGALNTKFVTPNGLDKDNNHSTAYDLAIITKYALQNETFVDYITTKEMDIYTKDKKRKFTFYNKNRFLNEYEGAFGVKTGFTNLAGHCFVGACERDGVSLLSVVLASGWGTNGKERKWTDTKKIMDYGFNNYSYRNIDLSEIDLGTIPVENSKVKELKLSCNENFLSLLSDEEFNNIKITKNIPSMISAPININQKIGYITIKTGDEILKTFDIVSEENIDKNDIFTNFIKILKTFCCCT